MLRVPRRPLASARLYAFARFRTSHGRSANRTDCCFTPFRSLFVLISSPSLPLARSPPSGAFPFLFVRVDPIPLVSEHRPLDFVQRSLLLIRIQFARSRRRPQVANESANNLGSDVASVVY